MRRLLWALLFTALLALLFASSALPQRLDVTVGEPAPHNIKAPMEFEDRPTTERLRAEAASEVPGVYEQDPSVGEDVLERLDEVYTTIRSIRADLGETEDTPVDGEDVSGNRVAEVESAAQALGEVAPISVGREDMQIILDASDSEIDEAHAQSESLLSFFFSQGVKSDGLNAFRDQIRESFERSELPDEFAALMGRISGNLLVSNLVYNAEETENRRRAAVESVEPVMILKGQVLVSDGEVITSEDMVRLRDAGLLVDDTPWRIYLSSVGYALILVTLAGFYFHRLDPDMIGSESRLVLIGLVFLVTLFIARLTMTVSPFLAPLAAGTILLAVLLHSHAAIFLGMLMSLGLFLVSGGDLRVVLVGLIGAIAASLAASRIEDRNDLMRAGITASVAGMIALVAYIFYTGGISIRDASLWRDLLWTGGNGVLSAVVAIGTLPFLEALFGMITPVKLVELASPTQPLLRRLLQEAPGTYHHSLMVANMAEAAVEAVRGDPVLTRVGAYFHDVGKARRPYFFVENQFASENPHDKLTPNLSALIVISHVKDGVEMARDAGLPEPVIDFIATHHGTTLAGYFYSRAKEAAGEESVSEEGFRYPGPRPQSKETAVVMLADAVEATVRSLSRPTPDRIRAVVRDIIHARLEDGQLDRCDLTLRDLDRVGEVFTQVLSGAFHKRLEYPESVVKAMEGEKKEVQDDSRDKDES
ncbi:MAG: HDIG domain-containing protein [Bacillota bacterium]